MDMVLEHTKIMTKVAVGEDEFTEVDLPATETPKDMKRHEKTNHTNLELSYNSVFEPVPMSPDNLQCIDDLKVEDDYLEINDKAVKDVDGDDLVMEDSECSLQISMNPRTPNHSYSTNTLSHTYKTPTGSYHRSVKSLVDSQLVEDMLQAKRQQGFPKEAGIIKYPSEPDLLALRKRSESLDANKVHHFQSLTLSFDATVEKSILNSWGKDEYSEECLTNNTCKRVPDVNMKHHTKSSSVPDVNMSSNVPDVNMSSSVPDVNMKHHTKSSSVPDVNMKHHTMSSSVPDVNMKHHTMSSSVPDVNMKHHTMSSSVPDVNMKHHTMSSSVPDDNMKHHTMPSSVPDVNMKHHTISSSISEVNLCHNTFSESVPAVNMRHHTLSDSMQFHLSGDDFEYTQRKCVGRAPQITMDYISDSTAASPTPNQQGLLEPGESHFADESGSYVCKLVDHRQCESSPSSRERSGTKLPSDNQPTLSNLELSWKLLDTKSKSSVHVDDGERRNSAISLVAGPLEKRRLSLLQNGRRGSKFARHVACNHEESLDSSKNPEINDSELTAPDSNHEEEPLVDDDTSPNKQMLLMSSSAIDITCIIYRVINFTNIVCKTVYPAVDYLEEAENDQMSGRMSRLTETSENTDKIQRCVVEQWVNSRQQVYSKLSEIISSLLRVYGFNILCQDICGLFRSEAVQVVGEQLVDESSHHYKQGLIWGCRHNAKGMSGCFHYVKRNTTILAKKFEPITKQMCVRVNNIHGLLDLLDHIQKEACNAVDKDHINVVLEHLIERDLLAKGGQSPTGSSQTDSTDPELLIMEIVENKNKADSLFKESRVLLRNLASGLTNLLAYRVNLFCREALVVLLDKDLGNVSLEERLTPLQRFLEQHFKRLPVWLYDDVMLVFVKKLWKHMMKNFDIEASKLKNGFSNYHHRALLLLQSISMLMNVFYKNCSNVSLESLGLYMEEVTFRLQLYTQPTVKLIILFGHLYITEDEARLKRRMSDTSYFPDLTLKRMRSELHGERKCFDGQQLIQWIISHPKLMAGYENTFEDSYGGSLSASDHMAISDAQALQIAQTLLDTQIIQAIQERGVRHATIPNIGTSSSYPDFVQYSMPKRLFSDPAGHCDDVMCDQNEGGNNSKDSKENSGEHPYKLHPLDLDEKFDKNIESADKYSHKSCKEMGNNNELERLRGIKSDDEGIVEVSDVLSINDSISSNLSYDDIVFEKIAVKSVSSESLNSHLPAEVSDTRSVSSESLNSHLPAEVSDTSSSSLNDSFVTPVIPRREHRTRSLVFRHGGYTSPVMYTSSSAIQFGRNILESPATDSENGPQFFSSTKHFYRFTGTSEPLFEDDCESGISSLALQSTISNSSSYQEYHPASNEEQGKALQDYLAKGVDAQFILDILALRIDSDILAKQFVKDLTQMYDSDRFILPKKQPSNFFKCSLFC